MSPATPERKMERSERGRRFWVFIGVIYVLVSSTAAASFGIIDYNSQINHHASSTRQQKEILQQGRSIIRQQKDNHNLGMSNHSLSVQIAIDAAQLTKDGTTIAAEFGVICGSLHISSPLCST